MGRKGGRKGGREEGRKGGREEGRKGGREEGRKGGREERRYKVTITAREYFSPIQPEEELYYYMNHQYWTDNITRLVY